MFASALGAASCHAEINNQYCGSLGAQGLAFRRCTLQGGLMADCSQIADCQHFPPCFFRYFLSHADMLDKLVDQPARSLEHLLRFSAFCYSTTAQQYTYFSLSAQNPRWNRFIGW